MYTEKRGQSRVDTHIPAEIIVKDTKERLPGFSSGLREERSEWVYGFQFVVSSREEQQSVKQLIRSLKRTWF